MTPQDLTPGPQRFWAQPYVTQTDLYRLRYYTQLIQNAKQRLHALLNQPVPDWKAIQIERAFIHYARNTLLRLRSSGVYRDIDTVF